MFFEMELISSSDTIKIKVNDFIQIILIIHLYSNSINVKDIVEFLQ